MRVKFLLHEIVDNEYEGKKGKVQEKLGIITESGEGRKCTKFFEIVMGDLIKTWKPMTCLTIDVVDFRVMFTGRVKISEFEVAKV